MAGGAPLAGGGGSRAHKAAIARKVMNGMIAKAETMLLYQLRDAYFSGNQPALLRAFYGLARTHWANGLADAAAENLAFLLLQDHLPPDLQESAEELWADIESRICPRIVLDARAFAAELDLQGMIEYLLEDNLN